MSSVASGCLGHFSFPSAIFPRMALALARKYRPRRFSDLLVQDHVAAVLRGAVVKNRVGHGYLLTGPRGVGKTTAARILAMALNCEKKGETEPAGEPCGVCENCQRIWTGSAGLDVVEIDAASNRGVDDARELRERAMYAASREGHHKVYIVDEAHMLTREAWNALLKILEEPPPGVVFVFATTEPQKIAQQAAPVLSRLQRFDFRRIGSAAIRDRLRAVLDAEKIEADDDALTLIARQADGGMRDALSVLDQCLSFGEGRVTADRVREILGLVADQVYAELLEVLATRNPAGVFTLLDRLEDAGSDLVEFIGATGEVLRALLMLQVGAKPEGITEALLAALQSYQGQLTTGELLRMLKLLGESEAMVRRSANPRLAVETLLLRWTLMDRTVDLEAVLAGAAPGGTAASPGTVAAPRGSAPIPPRAEASGATAAPRRSAETPLQAAPSPAPPAVRAPVKAQFTLDGLLRAWPDLVVAAREQSRFLGEAFAAAQPTAVEPPILSVSVPDGTPMHLEALGRQREAVERLLTQAVGAPVTLTVVEAKGSSGSPPPRTRRLSEAESRAERLKVLKGRDPALEAAAETLDLEVLE
jgi:DNA polymerase III subunit gamma/tau